MVTLPLGIGAYKRRSAREPEIRLVNRFVEKSPVNLKEHVALLSRPGNHLLANFPAGQGGNVRGTYSRPGLFNSDLFVVAGPNFYRYDGTTRTQIVGEVLGEGAPRVTWSKGPGYEYLFIADGQRLSYYSGGQYAKATLTYDGTGTYTTDVLQIGEVYYGWGADVTDPLQDGTEAHPFICKPGTDPLTAMANMIIYAGEPGVDFSSTLGGPNPLVTAEAQQADAALETDPAVKLVVSAREEGAAGNAIVVAVAGDPVSGNITWDHATLEGGGVHALLQIPVPDALGITAVTSLNSFVLVGVANSRRVYFIRPGEHRIDGLDFLEKESNPDPVIDLATVGDVAVVAGSGSTEYWAATGDNDAPFAPVQGRTAGRGIIAGTLVVVDDKTYVAVGNDGRVYAFTPAPQPLSDHGIEERIRVQLRQEAGL